MSVLGKRNRGNSDFAEMKDKHECSASPPHKKQKKEGEELAGKVHAMELDDEKDTRSVDVSDDRKKRAPSFSMQAVMNDEFITITDQALEGKWSILYFYPHDFEDASTENLKAFKGMDAKLKALNGQVIAVSGESHFAHLAWIQSEHHGLGPDLGICIASDLSTNVSKEYGVNVDGELDSLGHKVFIISPEKTIEYVSESQGIINPISVLDTLTAMTQTK